MWMTQCGPARVRLCNKKAGGNVVQRRIPRAHLTKGEISDPRLAPLSPKKSWREIDGESSWEGEARPDSCGEQAAETALSRRQNAFVSQRKKFGSMPSQSETRNMSAGLSGWLSCEAAAQKQQGARLHRAWRISTAGADRHLENDADLLVSNSISESMQLQSTTTETRPAVADLRSPSSSTQTRFVTNATT
jgi:hypothetical protein